MTADHTPLCRFLASDNMDTIVGWSLNIVRLKIPSSGLPNSPIRHSLSADTKIANNRLKAVLCSGDDAVLSFFWQVNPKGTIPGDPYLKVSVFFWMFLSLPQSIIVYHVELDVWNSPFFIPHPQVLGKQHLILSFQKYRQKPLVEELGMHEGYLGR